MSITKESAVDQTIINENGVICYRIATRLMEDGVKIHETYHRTSLTPGQDVSSHPASVRSVCALTWTPEIIAAYSAATLAEV
jgi:hypothetical protein